MPATGQSNESGLSSIARLHYFSPASDHYIVEKDIDGGVEQAYGYAILDGMEDFAEFGYISIEELVSCGAELDLHFEPQPLSVVLA